MSYFNLWRSRGKSNCSTPILLNHPCSSGKENAEGGLSAVSDEVFSVENLIHPRFINS